MKKPTVLFLPRWYPNNYDPQLGVFIYKQALAVSEFCSVCCIYVTSDEKDSAGLFQTEITQAPNHLSIIIYYKKSTWKILNFIRYYYAFVTGWRKAREKLGKLPDIIHIHMLLRNGIFGSVLSYCYNLPYVISEHWSGYTVEVGEYSKKTAITKYLYKAIIKRAKAVITVSSFLQTSMKNHGLRGNYHIIPNVIENPSPALPNTHKGIKILCVADQDDKKKNISGLINAIEKLKEKRHDFTLHIVGDGPDKNRLEHLAREKNLLNDLVYFHGLKTNEEVYDFLHNSDFLIVNSRVETFGVVAAEALSCGKPVIATDCGGVREFLSDNCGIIIKKDNLHELLGALNQMLDEHKNYNPQILREKVKDKFGYAQVGKSLLDVYSRALNQ